MGNGIPVTVLLFRTCLLLSPRPTAFMSSHHKSLPESTHHVYTMELSVRWGDMDAAGHVNNSRFFTYFEEARVEWMNEYLGDLQSDDTIPVLAHASCSFEQPVTHPATLIIEVYADPPGETSVTTHYRAHRADSEEQVAYGTAVLVWVDVNTGSPVPVPDLPL